MSFSLLGARAPTTLNSFVAKISDGNASSRRCRPLDRAALRRSLLHADALPRRYFFGAAHFLAARSQHAATVERLADFLGANLYSARLAGHGYRGADGGDGDDPAAEAGASLRDAATADALFRNAADAAAVGCALGERVVLFGCSTGGALCTWVAASKNFGHNVAAVVLISPAFSLASKAYPALKAVKAALDFCLPRARATRAMAAVLEAAQGKVKAPAHVACEAHARYWTLTYPTAALLHLVEVIGVAATVDVSAIECPSLIVGSHADPAVAWSKTLERYAAFGGTKALLTTARNAAENNHVLCNALLSPSSVGPLEDAILAFAKPLVAEKCALDDA